MYFLKIIDLIKIFLRISPDFPWTRIPGAELSKTERVQELFDRAPRYLSSLSPGELLMKSGGIFFAASPSTWIFKALSMPWAFPTSDLSVG